MKNTLETIDLHNVMGAVKKQTGVCSRTAIGDGWFPDTDVLVDPEGANFKTKKACERWAKKNLPL